MINGLKTHAWWIIGLVAAVYKISLLRSQHLYAISNAHHDDGLFMKLATHLVRGEWLGPYDQLTLSKGPAYPIFIALNFWVGLPLALTQQLLYLAACGVVVWALAPIVKAGWARLFILLFLFYNPLTYEGETMTRLLRQHLTVPLALIVAAGLIALTLRRQAPRADHVAWATLTGAALGVFWITREEGIWILPLVGCVVGAWWVAGAREGRGPLLWWLTLSGVIGLTAWVPTAVISAQNARHYGWWGAVDFRADAFQDAVGALTRVTIGPERPYVQVNREAREAIYLASPAFAELQPHLEAGPIADRWSEKDRFPVTERQYLTGWFNWALRDAIAAAGHAENPVAFLSFCRRLADEVNRACDEGRLAAGAPRSGFLPRWHPAYGEAMAQQWRRYLGEVLQLTRFETIVPPSVGTDDEIRPFVDLSYDNLSPSYTASYFHRPDQLEQNRVKLDRLRALADFWRGPFAGLIMLGLGLWGLRVLACLIRRQGTWLVWLGGALLAAVAAEVALNFLVHTMAFDNLYPAAWAPAYPLLQLFTVVAMVDISINGIQPLIRRVAEKRRPRPAD